MKSGYSKQALMLAIEAMSWIELRGVGVSKALADSARQLDVRDDRVISVANKLVRETLHRGNIIDKIVGSILAPSSLDDFSLGVQSFLRIFTYQTKFTGTGSEENVVLAGLGRSILGWKTLKPVEEALGKILAFNVDAMLASVDEGERISLQTMHPRWFVDYCINLIGREETLKLLKRNLEPPPTYIRVNTLREDEPAILKKLSEQGIVLEKVEGIRYLYKVIKRQKPLVRLEAYEEGLFYIEDKASCIPVEVADLKPGNIVFDICAAPGAKTTHMAQLLQNQGRIISIDYSSLRINTLKNELHRVGVDIAELVICDARKPLPTTVKADVVLLDPPCSGTGVFWRRPTLKWRTDFKTVQNLAKVQKMMLEACSEHVKKGGHLVYSTSSITLEENEFLIEQFLKAHPEFGMAETEPKIGIPALRNQEKCQRTYPHIHESNGSFTTKLTRI